MLETLWISCCKPAHEGNGAQMHFAVHAARALISQHAMSNGRQAETRPRPFAEASGLHVCRYNRGACKPARVGAEGARSPAPALNRVPPPPSQSRSPSHARASCTSKQTGSHLCCGTPASSSASRQLPGAERSGALVQAAEPLWMARGAKCSRRCSESGRGLSLQAAAAAQEGGGGCCSDRLLSGEAWSSSPAHRSLQPAGAGTAAPCLPSTRALPPR